MAKHQHAQYANRRLSGARQLLSQVGDEASAIYCEVCIDSALLQTYYGLFHYVNELLDAYQRPLIEDATQGLKELIINESRFVSELMEMKQLLDQSESYLSIVIDHSNTMLQAASASEQPIQQADSLVSSSTKEGVGQLSALGGNLIAVTQEDEPTSLDVDTTRKLIDQCYQLILHQRQQLLEC